VECERHCSEYVIGIVKSKRLWLVISGIAVWYGCVGGIFDPCGCGKADGEIRESYGSKRNLPLGKSGL
jgi:hypothetical protein